MKSINVLGQDGQFLVVAKPPFGPSYDVQALIPEMKKKNVKCSPGDEQRWGSITRIALPGGGTLGVYQSKHSSPLKAKTT